LEGEKNEIHPIELLRAVFVIIGLFEYTSPGSTEANHRFAGGAVGSAGNVPADGPER